MANPEHLAKLLQGVDAWNEWVAEHPETVADLSGADLSRGAIYELRSFLDLRSVLSLNFSLAELHDANLSHANLTYAILRGTHFQRADLRYSIFNCTDLSGADLTGANLWHCDLGGSNLSGANLSGANLTEAELMSANLYFANLVDANLTGARVGSTIFGDNDLGSVKGLETVWHAGPSTVGIDTIYRSQGKIPDSFLNGCGVPDDLVTFGKSLVSSPIEFYSCFISYSSEDERFAKELRLKLHAQGIRCWFAPEDLKIGDRFQERIEESIRLHDKLLVILSENSVNSAWVEREVQAAVEKEQRQGSTVLFPVRLDDAVMDSTRAWAADIRRARHIGDFRNWKDQALFQSSLDRLIRDLKAQRLPPAQQLSKHAQSASNIEQRILEALANGSWGPGPFTGAGDRLVRVTDIAEALSLENELVADTLEQLEARGRVMHHDGTLDNPAPYWSIVRRW